jgi:Fur family peroxide stress response transcriptional regulator
MGPHHHAVCDRCGLVRDVFDDNATERPPPAHHAAPRLALEDAPGFEVRSVERIYRGLCSDCARS